MEVPGRGWRAWGSEACPQAGPQAVFPKGEAPRTGAKEVGVPQPDECVLGGRNTLEGGDSPPEFPLGPISAFPDPGVPSESQLATSPGRDLGLRVCVCGQLCKHQQGVSLSMSESVCN